MDLSFQTVTTDSDAAILRLTAGSATVDLLPQRGMSVYQYTVAGTPLGGWSPIAGPVHPSSVPTWEPSGLGWLEGFNEVLVRCGLASNGPPIHDDAGRLVHPLHGRIGNLPAVNVQSSIDDAGGYVEVTASVDEQRFFFHLLRLQTRIRLHAGDGRLEIRDTVINRSSSETTAMLLYHINLGRPLLGRGIGGWRRSMRLHRKTIMRPRRCRHFMIMVRRPPDLPNRFIMPNRGRAAMRWRRPC